MHSLYLLINRVNGKLYVGQTSKTVGQRWRRHQESARLGRNYYVSNAIRKHGPDSFIVCALATTESKEDINRLEKECIALFQSHKPNMGYNCTLGGDGGLLTPESIEKLRVAGTGKVHSAEVRRKISDAKKGCKPRLSQEARNQISARLQGNQYRKGHKHSLETLTTWRRPKGPEHYKYRNDITVDMIDEIRKRVGNGERLRALAREYGVSRQTISRRLQKG